MRLLRFTAGLTIILASTAYSPAQQPACTLKRAPELRGFRLGMASIEARKNLAETEVFDSTMSSAGHQGSAAALISAYQLKPESAEGVDNIYLNFVDNRLAVIKVTFNGSAGWENAQDFFARAAESLGLPRPPDAASVYGAGTGNDKYKIECNGFVVTLAYSFGASPNVTMFDTAAQKIVDQRREQENTTTRRKTIGPGGGRRPLPPPPN